MRTRLDKTVAVCDALALLLALSMVLLLPVGFVLPFSDAWLRMTYLADHSPWEWTVMHVETWVVRPSAELVMAWLSWQTSRPALGPHWNPETFLLRFQAAYGLLALVLLVLLAWIARALVDTRRVLIAWAVAAGGMWICLWSSDGLGHAFYWADGYANVVLPFCCLVLGMALWSRGTSARVPAAVCFVLAALGHEVFCIYSIGFLTLVLLFGRRDADSSLLDTGLVLLLVAGLLALLYAQGFSAGPSRRTLAYLERTGSRYNVAGALRALTHIDVLRTALAVAATLCMIAIYRPWLHEPITRAVRYARAQRAFWILLVCGTWATSLVPLASVGLKKAKVAVGAYSVATELFVVLAAMLTYPWLDALLCRRFSPYRKHIRTGLPLFVCVALISPNFALYRSAVVDYSRLRVEAHAYIQQLFSAHGQRVTLTRPCHAFIKKPTGMTMRYAKEYFGLARFRELKCR